jgi:hypothetical protein
MKHTKEYVYDHYHFRKHTMQAFFYGFLSGFFLGIGLAILSLRI